MRTLLKAILIILSAACFPGCISTYPPSVNKVTKREAIEIASQLAYEMRDRDATLFLYEHGLSFDRSEVGDSFGWSLGFGLSDGGVLILNIVPEPVSPDGEWVNGRLKSAQICNWNNDVVATIKLKNAP